jgi:hypothetical protein
MHRMNIHAPVLITAGFVALLASAPATFAQPVAAPASTAAPQVDLQMVGSGAASGDQTKMLEEPEDLLRDPFWPVDYVRPEEVTAGPVIPVAPGEPPAPVKPTKKWDQAQRAIAIKGIIRSGNQYLANINNQLVAEKESVSVMFEGQKYSWTVTSITAKKVLFQPISVDEPTQAADSQAYDNGTMMGP